MTTGSLRTAEAFERLERLEDAEQALDLELLSDGRIRAERPEARELLRDRLRSAEVLPTGPGWAAFRSRAPGPPRELLGRAREVVAAGTLAASGWSIIDVIGFLSSGSQTGVLTVNDGARRSIFFCMGDVVWSASSAPLERLGAFLLARGKITRDQLHAALRDGPAGIGRASVERGYLGPEELEPLIEEFVRERFSALLGSESGIWSFARLDESPLAEAPFRLPTQALLVDGLRRFDELQVYRQRVRGPDVMVRRASDALVDIESLEATLDEQVPGLAHDAFDVLRSLSGASSIQDLVRRTGRSEFDVTRTVYFLLRANLLRLVRRPRSPSRAPAPAVDPREVVHIHGLALAEMVSELERTGREKEMLASVNEFMQQEGGAYRELLSNLRLDARGQIDAGTLVSSFEASGATADELVDALGELLFFALLRASEILGRRRGDDLARRVRLIHGMLRRGGSDR